MNILITDNGTGSRLWRLDPYVRWLRQNKHDVIQHPSGKRIEEIEAIWADIVICQMVLEKKVIDMFHKYNAGVIYEIDDLIEKVTKNHPSYHKLSRWITIWRTYNCILKSDLLFCSTKAIYNRYGWLKKKENKFIFPNLLDLNYWEKPYFPNTSEEIRIGWCGSWAHKEDLLFIGPILKKIIEKYPNVIFVYVGMGGVYESNSYLKWIYGEDLFPMIPPEKREYHEGVEADFWADKLAGLALDIGIAPVMNNEFSRAKSNIKYQEYAINRIPGIYSDVLYKDTVKDNYDGFVVPFDSAEKWFDKISWLIENEDERRKMGQNAYHRAKKEFNIERQYGQWFKTISQLYSRYFARKQRIREKIRMGQDTQRRQQGRKGN